MGQKAKRERGRPRKKESKLSRWLDVHGVSRDELASHLNVGRAYVDKICREERRPGLEIALAIEKLTKGAVPASTWLNVKPHSTD